LSEPQKAHPTGEFVVVAKNGGCAPFYLSSRLATVVSEAVRRNFNFWRFLKKFYIRPPVGDFVFLKMYFMFFLFMLDGLILFRKGDFRSEVCL